MENLTELQKLCLEVFNQVANTTFIFILPLVMAKIVFSNVIGEGSQALAAIKGAVIYFCLITAFPYIIEILFSIPESFLPKSLPTTPAPDFGLSSIPFSLSAILEVVLSLLYWVVYYLHVFFMLLMCSMAPVVFLCSSLLGIGLGIEVFMGLLIIGSSWPIIWIGFDKAHTMLLSNQGDEFGTRCLELILILFKGLAPIAFASLAVKSPAGRAVGAATRAVVSGGKVSIGAGVSVAARSVRPIIKLASNRLGARTKNSDSDRLKKKNEQRLEPNPSMVAVYESSRARNFKT